MGFAKLAAAFHIPTLYDAIGGYLVRLHLDDIERLAFSSSYDSDLTNGILSVVTSGVD